MVPINELQQTCFQFLLAGISFVCFPILDEEKKKASIVIADLLLLHALK